MIIDLRRPHQWEDLNDRVKEALGFEGTVKVFQSMSHALLEIGMGLQTMFAHKKQAYSSLGLGTHADEALIYLSRQGTKVTEYIWAEPPAVDDKKTLFCLADLDDAMTGQIYGDSKSSGVDPKVFRIWVSHAVHFHQAIPKVLEDTDILVLNSGDGSAIALFGKRSQNVQTPIAPTLCWEQTPTIKWVAPETNQEWVKKVEADGWGGGQAYFLEPTERYYDRALLFWSEFDAGALRDVLIQSHSIDPNHLEAFSLSRWNEVKLIAQFSKRSRSPEVFRGLLAISASLSSRSDFKKALETAIQELRQLSVPSR